MALKSFKPTSPGRRFQTVSDFAEITTSRPEKSLLAPLKKTGGRNCNGRVTARHIGGGHKRRYRIIDFKRDKYEVPAKVVSIEYDPNRTARIALLHYLDGEKRYILAPDRLEVGHQVVAGENAEITVGNALPIRKIPVGTHLHNIELKQGKGGQLARSAGVSAQLAAKENESGVDKSLRILIDSGESIGFTAVKDLLESGMAIPPVTDVTIPNVRLAVYDSLLRFDMAVAQ